MLLTLRAARTSKDDRAGEFAFRERIVGAHVNTSRTIAEIQVVFASLITSLVNYEAALFGKIKACAVVSLERNYMSAVPSRRKSPGKTIYEMKGSFLSSKQPSLWGNVIACKK